MYVIPSQGLVYSKLVRLKIFAVVILHHWFERASSNCVRSKDVDSFVLFYGIITCWKGQSFLPKE